jgi:molybdopterin-guanine dinucleotide biosynthesis protein B
LFDRVIVVDWSAANLPTSATNRANAIWIGCHDAEGGAEWHHRTRAAAEAHLQTLIDTARADGLRLLVGFDFAMGYPYGFAARLTGSDTPALWAWLAARVTDTPDNVNNRFAVAAAINALFPEGPGPFWSHPTNQSWPGLPTRRAGIDFAALGLAECRHAETAVPRAKSPWMLFNPGSVGSQSLLGLPMIHRLSQRSDTAVWPFQPPDAPVVLAEIYPSLLAGPVAILANAEALPADQAQVRLLSRVLYRLARHDRLAPLFDAPAIAAEEGWILGAQHAPLLSQALTWA